MVGQIRTALTMHLLFNCLFSFAAEADISQVATPTSLELLAFSVQFCHREGAMGALTATATFSCAPGLRLWGLARSIAGPAQLALDEGEA